MALGGGIFQKMDKLVPGIYINVNYEHQQEIPTAGIVAILISVNTDAQETKIQSITKWNFDPVAKYFNGENEKEAYELFLKLLKDTFLYASLVYLVPFKMGEAHATTPSSEELERLLLTISYNVLICWDHLELGFGTDADRKATNLITAFSNIFTKTNTRFPVLYGTTLQDSIEELRKNVDVAKWFVLPYLSDGKEKESITSVFFLGGLLSTCTIGENIAGVPYTGSSDTTYWIPETTAKQEACLKDGRIGFYKISSHPTAYILKDITALHTIPSNVETNLQYGSVVRMEQHFYTYLTNLFQSQIQGKPNSVQQRSIIRATILGELYRLQSLGVIEEVQEDHVVVSPTEEKNKISIQLKYLPVYGIDYVYISVVVN